MASIIRGNRKFAAPIATSFPTMLRFIRESQGLKRRDVIKDMSFSLTHLSNIESMPTNVGFGALEEIADVYEVKIWELIMFAEHILYDIPTNITSEFVSKEMRKYMNDYYDRCQMKELREKLEQKLEQKAEKNVKKV